MTYTPYTEISDLVKSDILPFAIGTVIYLILSSSKTSLKAINVFVKNLNAFKKDINSKNNNSILKKLIQTKKVRSKIIKLKQDVNKPDFGR